MVFREFKDKCKIKSAIIDFNLIENEFSIYIYCLEKDIDFNKEKKHLMHLHYKHRLCYD